MPVSVSSFSARRTIAKLCSKGFVFTTALLVVGVWHAKAQQLTPAAQPIAAVSAGPLWSELTPAQQATLKPLAQTWESLEPVRKQKWLSVATTYPRLTATEQEKIQSRMAEWAALTPRQRAVARLNYAETKKVSPSDRSADWDAYQALSPEDRKKLAANARPAPLGAAIAPKQSAADKVIPVPITRRTSANDQPSGVTVPLNIDRKTLLPQAPKPVKAASDSRN